MNYYFLLEDLDKLNEHIFKINARIKNIGKEMGASCQEGAETFHDNFAFEDGERQQQMWSKRLNELLHINNNATIYKPDSKLNKVCIGSVVTLYDEVTEEIKTIQIGSYMTFNNGKSISYNAPLSKILLGAFEGDVRKGKIGDRFRSYEVLEIGCQ